MATSNTSAITWKLVALGGVIVIALWAVLTAFGRFAASLQSGLQSLGVSPGASGTFGEIVFWGLVVAFVFFLIWAAGRLSRL